MKEFTILRMVCDIRALEGTAKEIADSEKIWDNYNKTKKITKYNEKKLKKIRDKYNHLREWEEVE
tara:strand:+ start:401 stop:595 length:195 start_codon:yes stop_codon:yes gene_type:complete